MYITPDTQKRADSLFTEHEQLYGSLKPERLLEIVKDKRCKVMKFDESTNMYGSFWFITFDFRGVGCFGFYGMGENDQAERFQRNFSETESSFKNARYNYRKCSPYSWHVNDKHPKKDSVIKELEFLIHQNPTEQRPSTRRGELFSLLEELGDSDSALCELQDMGL